MFSERFPRLGFQTITTLLFLYQMKQSIVKYMDSPTTLTKLNAPKTELVYEPYLIVCQTSQYNYHKAKIFGYDKMYSLWAGIFTSNSNRKLTWKGKTQNLSFNTISKELYDYDYSLVTLNHGRLGKEYLSLNLGMCVQLDDLGTDVIASMNTNRTLNLLAVDPNTFNEVRIDLDPKASVTVGPRYDGRYEWADVLLQYTVTDNAIKNGAGCRVYENSYSYAQCVTEALKVILPPLYLLF